METRGYVSGGLKAKCLCCHTAVVGTGAAGYAAAERLWQLGVRDILIVTEDRLSGTSRNAGSDKQTYYKLTLSGDTDDSAEKMARTLFDGQCMDGDVSLCEAALSVRGFMHLVELGVPFPYNDFGEYVGYKTDHDPKERATSAGPYTSREMTRALERSVMEKGVPIQDHHMVVQILSDGSRVYGLLCLDTQAGKTGERFVLIQCRNVIYATGGPAGMYENSAYPVSQFGASGIAFEAGAGGRNLTEWQYGLASRSPRWNVSGTYMQILPRMISTAQDGSDPREFLLDFFPTREKMMSTLFLKGYQWPFDAHKAMDGSSIIDILVFLETSRERRVWLDYRDNPGCEPVCFEKLDRPVREYLQRADACFGTPIQRLLHMNEPAVAHYKAHGIDLQTQMLEISFCAQHNNGGLGVDSWWQTDLRGLFAVGEAAGSHGVCRPGGSALNAGQVGALRAAQYIALHQNEDAPDSSTFDTLAAQALQRQTALVCQVLDEKSNVRQAIAQAGRRMDTTGSALRDRGQIAAYLQELEKTAGTLPPGVRASEEELMWAFRLRDMLLSQYVYLSAMADYIDRGGRSRGGCLYLDPQGENSIEQLGDAFRFSLDNGDWRDMVQQAHYKNGRCRFSWRKVHPIPKRNEAFETVWRAFRTQGTGAAAPDGAKEL